MASRIYITYVDKEGPFLKIWGQTERNSSIYVEKSLQELMPQFEQGLYLPSPGSVQIGVLCCAKYKDGIFYRGRITNIVNQGTAAEIHFIDYGNKDVVPIINIRSLTSIPSPLISIPPQARDFILSGIMHRGQTWDDQVLTLINNEIRYIELQWGPIANVGIYTLIKLFQNGRDITPALITRGLVSSVNFSSQQQILHNFSSHVPTLASPVQNILSPTTQPMVPFQPQPPPQVQPTLLTYKLFSLEPGSEHNVYVSYVSDGPCHFSVQLQKLEDTLTRLMKEINRMPLQPLEEDPLPGTVCVARCSEDNHICRAVVTSVVDNMYKVFFVDFGNTELLTIDNLYQIPFKFVIPKVMAMRYALAGLDRSSVTVEMKCAFKEFVEEKLLRMRVLPAPARTALPLCELWNEENVNVLDVIRSAALVAYPEPIQLTRGFSQEVKVSYVHSCSRFYVQLKSKEEELKQVMEQLQVSCPRKPILKLSDLREGKPCCALFEDDGLWYRAEVLSIKDNSIKVIYVDYGNEDVVLLDKIRIPEGELLSVLRPQALECCLNGYQKMDVDLERDTFLEELILEKYFTMKVVEMQGNKALIELTDSSKYNVASLLLDKIAAAHSQMSPLLIQDGHRVEQRKFSSPDTAVNYQQSRPRDERGFDHNKKSFGGRETRNDDDFSVGQDNDTDIWNSKSSDKGNWRQKKPSPRGRENNWGESSKFNKNRDSRNTNTWNEHDDRDKWKKKSRDKVGNYNNFFKSRGEKTYEKSPNFSGSEKSFTDTSDKNWRNKPQSGFRGDRDRGEGKGGFGKSSPTWRSSSKPTLKQIPLEPLDMADPDAAYPVIDLQDKTEVVSISWFYNPSHFYCQLETSKDKFKQLMEDIQTKYQNRPSDANNLRVGSPVIAQFPEDKVLYRAQIIEFLGFSRKVVYVDFGNIATTDKIWPIDKKFLELPIQAVSCGLALSPFNDSWPDPDTFSSYFDKSSYTCNFVSFDDNKYIVELYDNCVNVSDLLVSASLARVSSEPQAEFLQPKYPAEVHLSLLPGQNLKVTLSTVNSLEDFKVVLPNGQEVACYLFNVTNATQKWEDTLKQKVGYPVIVYVSKFSENKCLEVIVYDTNGEKLKLIEPDESLEWVSHLCPMPVLASPVACWVSALTENGAFIQPVDFEDTVAQLLDSTFNSYEGTAEETCDIQEGFIFAVKSEDGNWYRGLVISPVEQDNVSVLYIDYGNKETVNVSKIRNLKPEHVDLHSLALEVFVSPPLKEIPEDQVLMSIWLEECGWKAELCTSSETKSEGIPVILSHFDSPSEFYLQLSEALEKIDSIQAALQEQIESLEYLENTSAGILCAAQYSLDGVWYRCQVLDTDADITSVRFIDYGNTDVLDNKTAKLKTLPSDLLSLEQYARRCSLSISPLDEEWSESALNRFNELVDVEGLLNMKIIHQDEKTTYVELYSNGEIISERLISEGLARKLTFDDDNSCKGFISHLNSPSEFWIQLENSVGDLEWIAEQLSVAEKFPELDNFAPGSLCAALFPEDGMWYRARILSNTVAGLEVIFIDYGNSCTCIGLRQLPEDLLLLPPLALKCSLKKPAGVAQWTPETTQIFRELSADGATIFNLHKITTGETSVVELFLNETNIVKLLLPRVTEGFVSHFESEEEVWVQKAEDEAGLQVMTDRLLAAHEWPVLDQNCEELLVAAQFVDDELWYRAEILKKDGQSYTVRFIDYGNTSEATDIRKLPEDIEKLPPLVTKCRLDDKWVQTVSEDFKELLKTGETKFVIEFVTENVVKLSAGNVESIGDDVVKEIVDEIFSEALNDSKGASKESEVKEIVEDIVTSASNGKDGSECDQIIQEIVTSACSGNGETDSGEIIKEIVTSARNGKGDSEFAEIVQEIVTSASNDNDYSECAKIIQEVVTSASNENDDPECVEIIQETVTSAINENDCSQSVIKEIVKEICDNSISGEHKIENTSTLNEFIEENRTIDDQNSLSVIDTKEIVEDKTEVTIIAEGVLKIEENLRDKELSITEDKNIPSETEKRDKIVEKEIQNDFNKKENIGDSQFNENSLNKENIFSSSDEKSDITNNDNVGDKVSTEN